MAARRLDNRAARDRLKFMGRAALKARVRRHLRRAGRLARVGLRPGPARRRHQPTEGLHRGRHGRVFLAAYALLLPVHRHAYEIVDGPCHVFFDLECEGEMQEQGDAAVQAVERAAREIVEELTTTLCTRQVGASGYSSGVVALLGPESESRVRVRSPSPESE